jgi:signal transduction histidine kinase
MKTPNDHQNYAIIAERNRIARDIHDTLSHGFTGILLQLEIADQALADRLPRDAAGSIRRARELALESLQDMRHSISGIRSPVIEERNLCGALDSLIKKMTSGSALRTEFIATGRTVDLPARWQENLLNIGREALTNTIRRARASRFNVRVSYGARELRLNLDDDGRGFDPGEFNGGFGLQGMRERAETVGGLLSVSSVKGIGTSIRVALPLCQLNREN